MKKSPLLLNLFLLFSLSISAQNKLGIDIASVSNRHSMINGLNISAFYHFNEQLAAGVEMNRFFPVTRNTTGEDVQLSAWDFDYNLHYLVPLSKQWKLYPLTGFSHTTEKELNLKTGETSTERFWSYNTGAGILCELGKWSPHIEYSFTWGHINQQFLIAGFSYEIEWGEHKKKD